jgi:hypothetical protein
VGAVAFYLLVRGDGAEYNFGKLALVEGAVGYASVCCQQSGRRWDNWVSYPTTSSGCFTMAMLRCVRSYTSRAM